jgi:protocatechuate 3,4-dioxygenase beta subunit
MRKGLMVAAGLCFSVSAFSQSGCGAPTPADIEGPFYKPGAPARASLLEPAGKGEKLVLSGMVRAADCRPLAGVKLDFWQADAGGAYDNQGYRYRGVVTSDAQGRYQLETILPPPYMGRPRHIHVKLHRPGGKLLTTQLYFPGESRGADPGLIVKLENRDGTRIAGFDFVLF